MRGIRQYWQNIVALSDNQIGLALLALGAGLLTSLVIVLLRLVIEVPFVLFLGVDNSEQFEQLSYLLRIAMVLSGGLILVLIFRRLPASDRGMGIPYTIQQMDKHQGTFPLKNAGLQWLGAAIGIVSGHSGGREGPSVHLGAATSSWLGGHAGIARHRLRILAAAGVASAISACFNTPMAGVIFAMEVVLLEYSIRGFIPIILASVAGAIVSRAVFGADTTFNVGMLDMHSLWEIPYVLLLGLMAGFLAAAFIHAVKFFQRLNHYSLWVKWGGLSLITASIGIILPQALGVGYDSLSEALHGQALPGVLIGLLLAKFILGSWGAAVGFPTGLIGPTLILGASLGGLFAQASLIVLPDYPTPLGFYAMLGMGAMMGAVLRAPLAALVALLEMTANPNIIMPGMLVIVIASLVVSEIFKLPSVFAVQLGNDLQYQKPKPVQRMLQNTWVAEVLQRSVITVTPTLTPSTAELILNKTPNWLLLEHEQIILPPAALAEALAHAHEAPHTDTAIEDSDGIDLLSIPSTRFDVARISLQANLQEALDLMQNQQLEWLAVYRDKALTDCVGLVARADIEHFYRYQPRGA